LNHANPYLNPTNKKASFMSEQQHFDDLVIGSGEGGKYLAWHLAHSGRQTVVIERRWIGGSCPNTNCLPSKNEVWSAKVATLTKRAAEFGMDTGPIAVNMPRVLARKREMVDGLIAMHLSLFESSGAKLIMGHARLTGPKAVEVALNAGGSVVVTTDRLFLNLGTRATIPDLPGLAAANPLTNVELLELDRVPNHLVVLGGGYVGLEMAQAYRRFGAEVTILEAGGQLASREDPDVAAAILQTMQDEGIAVHLGVAVREVHGRSGDSVILHASTSAGDIAIQGSDLLVATGRTPNTSGIGLEAAGVKLDSRGFVVVNERLEATAPGCGRSASARAARSSRTHASTIFVSSATT
jgi:pyruvate/2-oxoglutarate dehydrogenase complex dihydrolipoamide dehydrogenase (E3) component